MKKLITFERIKNYTDKDNIVLGLANSGYAVRTEQKKDDLGRIQGWTIDVYEEEKTNGVISAIGTATLTSHAPTNFTIRNVSQGTN